MEFTEEDFYNRLLLAYEQKQFEFLTINWRTVPSHIRLEIMIRAFRDGEKDFINKSHFEIHENDLKIIQDAKKSYIEKFDLTPEEVRELYWWHNTNMSVGNKFDSVIRNLAITAKLKEYTELTEKYECLTPELIKRNPNILKCDSRRTESRIRFLLEQNNGEIPENVNLIADLTTPSRWFNLRYQREIQEKIASIDSESSIYKTLIELDVKTPDYANDKFLELCLRAMYGDKTILDAINKKRDEIEQIGNPENNTELNSSEVGAKNPANIPASETSIADKIEELLDDVLPADEGYRYRSSGYNPSLSETKPNNRESLNERRIDEFLQELNNLGIECEGYISSKSGSKAIDEEQVRYYVLKEGNYRILEPIGQVGNSTVVLRNGESIEELKRLLGSNTKTDLVRKGVAILLNHRRTEDQSYQYSANRICNMITLIEEFSQEKSAGLSISAIKDSITKMVSQEEIPEASKYIWELGKSTSLKIARNVIEMEKRANEEANVKPKPTTEEVEM